MALHHKSDRKIGADYVFKIILVGCAGVGKSSIITRYANNTFDDNIANTIGIDLKMISLIVNDIKIRLHIWDTCGQEKYSVLASSFIHNVDGILLVYDITDLASFTKIDAVWHTRYQDYVEYDNASKILVGNKLDLEEHRVVKKDIVIEYAQKMNWDSYECSAASRTTGRDVIANIMLSLINKILLRKKERNPVPIQLNEHKKDDNKKEKCC
jgi:Ras-related protein Rab-1A